MKERRKGVCEAAFFASDSPVLTGEDGGRLLEVSLDVAKRSRATTPENSSGVAAADLIVVSESRDA